jgi:hypothetical protein
MDPISRLYLLYQVEGKTAKMSSSEHTWEEKKRGNDERVCAFGRISVSSPTGTDSDILSCTFIIAVYRTYLGI